LSDPSPDPQPAPEPGVVPARRFRLLDTVFLIAAVAVGQRGYLAVMSIYTSTGIGSPGQVFQSIRRHGLLSPPYHVLFWFDVSAPMLLSLTVGLFGLRRLSPRPSRSVLGRQPGSVAVSAGLLGAAFVFAAWGLVGYPLVLAGKFVAGGIALSTSYPLIYQVMLTSMVAGGGAIASGWGGLLLNGSSLKDADWVEWSGRILGLSWLLATPFYLWAALITY
jgi:hypothetical protein